MPLRPPSGFGGEFLVAPQQLLPWSRVAGPWEVMPTAVARPRDVGDVAAIVGLAAESGLPLISRGGGTGMPGGNLGTGLILDLSRPELSRIGPVDPDGGRVRVGPGAIAASVDREAARHGLRLPPLPSSAERCTVGGMVGTNAAGARSLLHGSIRDWVIALEVVLADGSVQELRPGVPLPLPDGGVWEPGIPSGGAGRIQGWPEVRKNSSGYALDRFLASGDPVQLIVGSEGTLGVVTGVTLRLAPRTADRVVLLLALPRLEMLAPLSSMARRHGAVACEFLGRRLLELVQAAGSPVPGASGREEAVLLVEFEGSPEEPAGAAAAFRGDLPGADVGIVEAVSEEDRSALWGLRHRASPLIQAMAERGLRSLQVIEDSVVPPDRLGAYLEGVRQILEAARIDHVAFGHAGDGNAHVNLLVDLGTPGIVDRLRAVVQDTASLVKSLGGTLSGEHGDGRLRAPLLERIWGSGLVDVFRRVKTSFDPDGILNPGVILPLPGQDPMEGLAGTGGAGSH